MAKWMFGIIAACSLPACTNHQLRSNTAIQTSTLSDLQYQIVLKNLAMFACNPHAIPFQANLHDGTAQIADNGSIVAQVLADASLTLGAQRTAVDQWSMTPVTDDIALRLLRLAYQRVVPGFDVNLYSEEADDLDNDLDHKLKEQTTTVDDLRTINQIAQIPEISQTQTAEEVRNAQKEFVKHLALLLNWPPRWYERIDEKLTGNRTDFERMAALFAEAIGDRNEYEISNYGEQLARLGPGNPQVDWLATLTELNRNLRRAAAYDSKLTKDEGAHSEVANSIRKFLLALNGDVTKQAEWRLAAEQLFEVYRSWPEQSQMIGVRHREISSFRIADQKVLSTNRAKIIMPGEKLDDDNLDFVGLPEYLTVLIYMQPLRIPRKPHTYERKVQLIACRLDEAKYRACCGQIDVWENIEANQVQLQIDEVFGPGKAIVSGGPLSLSTPITVSFVGGVGKPCELGDPPFKSFLHKKNMDFNDEIQIKSVHRYMKATPLVVELRRQVMEVEHDLKKIHPGWLGIGSSRHEIPKNACYWACWSECGERRYVWVCPEHREEFADFTIKILNFSSLIKSVNVTGAAGVKYSPATASSTIR